ncbi:Hpt domain-containing protein [Clostridium saccharoperbutylacetonicum]|uniref:Hpt domain-containing protein n=1 Tax=Clostridium saccharoperbutylacetonicum TaxID=36745 RepID=UPI0039ED9246
MNFNCKYDIIGFSTDLGLSIKEISELYYELINELNLALLELKALVDGQNYTKIQKIIHNIKGVSGNYRINDIYKETTRINDLLISDDYSTLKKDLTNLFTICIDAQTEIRFFFEQALKVKLLI